MKCVGTSQPNVVPVLVDFFLTERAVRRVQMKGEKSQHNRPEPEANCRTRRTNMSGKGIVNQFLRERRWGMKATSIEMAHCCCCRQTTWSELVGDNGSCGIPVLLVNTHNSTTDSRNAGYFQRCSTTVTFPANSVGHLQWAAHMRLAATLTAPTPVSPIGFPRWTHCILRVLSPRLFKAVETDLRAVGMKTRNRHKRPTNKNPSHKKQ